MGQSYAAATAITRALIGWTKIKGILKIIHLQNLKEVTLERRLTNLINILLVVTQEERNQRNLVDLALEEETKIISLESIQVSGITEEWWETIFHPSLPF